MNDAERIILIGMKSSGKTTVGRVLAEKLGIAFTDMDALIEQLHFQKKNEELPFREIFKRYGGDYFRAMETEALKVQAEAGEPASFVLATGGGLPLAEANQALLPKLGTVVYLDADPDVLLDRIVRGGVPAFFPYQDDPKRSLDEILAARRPVYQGLAQLTIAYRHELPGEVADQIIQQLGGNSHED